jgi:hypothetical protein
MKPRIDDVKVKTGTVATRSLHLYLTELSTDLGKFSSCSWRGNFVTLFGLQGMVVLLRNKLVVCSASSLVFAVSAPQCDYKYVSTS